MWLGHARLRLALGQFGPVSVQFGPVLAIGRSWLVRHGHGWFSGWSAARGWVYFLNRTTTKSHVNGQSCQFDQWRLLSLAHFSVNSE